MSTLRTPETSAKYKADRDAGGLDRGCVICGREALREFVHWKIVFNEFPYDKIATTHHILAPNVHLAQPQISEEAWREFESIKKSDVNSVYDVILENTPKNMTIPAHFHVHLLVTK